MLTHYARPVKVQHHHVFRQRRKSEPMLEQLKVDISIFDRSVHRWGSNRLGSVEP